MLHQKDLIPEAEERLEKQALAILRQAGEEMRMRHLSDPDECRRLLQDRCNQMRQDLTGEAQRLQGMILEAVRFCGETFPEQECFLLLSGFAKHQDTALFLTEHPSDEMWEWMRGAGLWKQEGR